MWKNTAANATVDGKFTDGDSELGIPRSVLGAAFLNMLLEELQNAVTGSGQALAEGNHSQLLQAIRNMGFSTGDGKITLKTVADTGWVMADDGTIGKLGSGATTRANDDTEALYTLLWTNVLDAHAPVSGGRGLSAAADFAAGKTIALTKQLGRAIAVAGAGAGLTARPLGSVVGDETHALTEAEGPAHRHFALHDQLVVEPPGVKVDADHAAGSGVDDSDDEFYLGNGVGDADVGQTSESGSGDPHNNMQPSSFWNVMIKL